MSCRYPGGVRSPAELWELVAAAKDGITEFPADRGWDLERLYDPDPDSPGTSYVREGGFLHDAADFDAEFFGIGPREAVAMDPQQRLLLEACWEALEDGGIDPASLGGTPTGVFAGVMYGDYGYRANASTKDAPSPYRCWEGFSLANRLSQLLGFHGPSLAVDTACSSSGTALHLACNALKGGECAVAIAGGVNLILDPDRFGSLGRLGILLGARTV
jgi:acyl transferase domain-containing protein